MHCRVRCYSLLLFLVASAPMALATTQELRTGGDLVTAADAIVHGRCSAIETEWRDRALATRYRITVHDALKGDVGTEITLWVPGGVDHQRKIPIAVTVPGAPALFTGEEVLLFLVEAPEAGGYSLINFAQGKFPVFSAPGEETWVPLGPGEAGQRRSLSTVKNEIRSFLEEEAQKEGGR